MKKRYNCRSSLKALLYYPLRFGKLWYLIKAITVRRWLKGAKAGVY